MIEDILGKRYKFKYPVLKKEIRDICLDDLAEPIMYGRDKYGKYFITMKVVADYQDISQVFAQTFYQRYPDYSDMWASCAIHDTPNFMIIDKKILPHQIDFLQRLINNEVVDRVTLPKSETSKEVSVSEYIFNVRLATSIIAIYKEEDQYFIQKIFYKIFEKSFYIVDNFLYFFGY